MDILFQGKKQKSIRTNDNEDTRVQTYVKNGPYTDRLH
jgi:hypothetical protein